MPTTYKLPFALAFFTLLLAACSAPSQSGAQATTEQTSSPTETLGPTATPAPTDIPTPAPTATFSGPWLTPLEADVDCRFGPTPFYERMGTLEVGAAAEILGISEDVEWFQTANPEDPSTMCWFNGILVATNGDISQLPVVQAPVAKVTKIELLIPRDFIGYSDYTNGDWPDGFTCDKSVDYEIDSTVWINGPTTVTYHWEIHGDIDIIGDELSVALPNAGNYGDLVSFGPTIQPFNFTLTQCGDFSVRFVVTNPNQMILEGQFTIPLECRTELQLPTCELTLP